MVLGIPVPLTNLAQLRVGSATGRSRSQQCAVLCAHVREAPRQARPARHHVVRAAATDAGVEQLCLQLAALANLLGALVRLVDLDDALFVLLVAEGDAPQTDALAPAFVGLCTGNTTTPDEALTSWLTASAACAGFFYKGYMPMPAPCQVSSPSNSMAISNKMRPPLSILRRQSSYTSEVESTAHTLKHHALVSTCAYTEPQACCLSQQTGSMDRGGKLTRPRSASLSPGSFLTPPACCQRPLPISHRRLRTRSLRAKDRRSQSRSCGSPFVTILCQCA